MRKSRMFVVAVAAAWAMAASTAKANLDGMQANLDGLQEVPPNASPAFGLADASLDDVSGAFTIVSGSYQDLLGGASAVTLNDAAVGTNGPVILALTLDTPGAATGTFSGSGILTPAQITDMLAGNTYINIRSNVFPSGEIRGQLFQVPEPSSMVLLCVAGVGLLAAAWRRRRAAC